jgi:hypothetical protein
MYRLLALVLTLGFALAAQMFTDSKPSNEDNASQLQELLAKSAASLGGADKLRAVRSFSMTGTFRRAFPDQDRSGVYEISFMSPDKFKKVETAETTKDVRITVTQTLNKDEGWSDTDIKTGKLELNIGKPGSGAQPSSPNARKQMRADIARHLLAWFIAEPTLYSMGFHYDKQDPASGLVLNLNGPDNFSARVVLDSNTHLPLMMNYRGRPPVIAVNESEMKEMPAYETEIQVHFSDYRAENGIVLPHHIKVESDGKFLEEFEMKTCRVNPPEVTASDFRSN